MPSGTSFQRHEHALEIAVAGESVLELELQRLGGVTRPFQQIIVFHLRQVKQIWSGPGEEFQLAIPELDIQAGAQIAVLGSSGCGKSSLVRAGLLPALQRGYLGEREADWRFVIMKPGGEGRFQRIVPL